jgi:DNA-binding MarR family transcriptional regulator
LKALDGLEPVFEHRARLAIGVLLARHGEISFARFKQQLQLTDGNLGAQLRKLEDAGCITLRRDFVNHKPVTWYALTRSGRQTLNRHLRALQSIIGEASRPASATP